MFSNTIDIKPLFKKPNGDVVKDLTKSIFDLNVNTYVAINAYTIPKEYAMRPDLISLAVYNTIDYAEIIMKYNAISNPFSINEGDVIIVPDINAVKEMLKSEESYSNGDALVRNSHKYLDLSKIPTNDNSITEFNNRNLTTSNTNNTSSDNDQALPPNIAPEGATQITTRSGRIYFGENVSPSCVKNGITISDYLTKVIKSNL